MFAEMLPGPLKSLRFTKLDLGAVPPVFDSVDVHSRREGFFRLNLDVAWEGESDIELKADHLPALGVRKVRLRGRVSIGLGPLVDRLPVITAAKVSGARVTSIFLRSAVLREPMSQRVCHELVLCVCVCVLAPLKHRLAPEWETD